MKRTIVAGGILSALVAAVLAVGLASAQTETPEPTVTDKPQRLGERFKEELAQQLGISLAELDTALDNTQLALIDEAVADGKLTESEAERLRERVEEGQNLFPIGDARHGNRHHAKVELVESAAQVLGIGVDDVRAGIADGQTLAEIAGANGMDAQDFKSALLQDIKSTLDEKVSAGDITQDQADRIHEHLAGKIDDIINHEPRHPRDGRPFPHFERGPRFWQDGPPFGDDDSREDKSEKDKSEEDNSPTIF